MSARFRPWTVFGGLFAGAGLAVAAVFVSGCHPPNYAKRGFTSFRCEFAQHDKPVPEVTTEDAALVAAVADELRTAWATSDCKCGAIARLIFQHPDGTTAEVDFVPAHDAGTVEFRTGGRRYWMTSAAFFRAVAPLGVPPECWTGSRAK